MTNYINIGGTINNDAITYKISGGDVPIIIMDSGWFQVDDKMRFISAQSQYGGACLFQVNSTMQINGRCDDDSPYDWTLTARIIIGGESFQLTLCFDEDSHDDARQAATAAGDAIKAAIVELTNHHHSDDSPLVQWSVFYEACLSADIKEHCTMNSATCKL